MDRQELVELYKDLMTEETQKFYNNWYERYRSIKKAVADKKIDLEKNSRNLDVNNDDDLKFLKRLILEKNNGVADAGWGEIKDDNDFFDLIGAREGDTRNDDNVLEFVKAVIMNPDFLNSKRLFENVKKVSTRKGHEVKNRNVIVNRIVAACTEEVSSTVDIDMFNKVFIHLVGAGKMIDDISRGFTVTTIPIMQWYDRNTFLLKAIREILKEEMGEEPDPTYSSQLSWHIYFTKLS